jgi:hypothetical protein
MSREKAIKAGCFAIADADKRAATPARAIKRETEELSV